MQTQDNRSIQHVVIHPSSTFVNRHLLLFRIAGDEASEQSLGKRKEQTRPGHQSFKGRIHQSLTHSYLGAIESPINLMRMSLDCSGSFSKFLVQARMDPQVGRFWSACHMFDNPGLYHLVPPNNRLCLSPI